jgi:hypothetical protein
MSVVDDLLDLDTTYLMMPAADGVVQQRKLMQQEGVFEG